MDEERVPAMKEVVDDLQSAGKKKKKQYGISTPLTEKEYYDVQSYCLTKKLTPAEQVRILLVNAGIIAERKEGI